MIYLQEPARTVVHSLHRLHAGNLADVQAAAPPTHRVQVKYVTTP